MPNSGYIRNRDFPSHFLHPQFNEQLNKEQFEAMETQQLEEHASICPGHKLTKTHITGPPEDRRYIVEVVLNKGTYFIEAPCTFTPALGLDVLDGNLVYDAEEWILVQELRLKPRRLRMIFGHEHRLPYQDYIKKVTAIHAGWKFQDLEAEFELPAPLVVPVSPKSKRKKWWKFW